MLRVKCCGNKQRSTNYIIEPERNFTASIMAVLNPCSVCKEFVIMIDSLLPNGDRHIVKKKGSEALKLFENISNAGKIICELKNNVVYNKGGWFLYYYDNGKKLKCYSNLATLRLGLSEPYQELPQGDAMRVINGSIIR